MKKRFAVFLTAIMCLFLLSACGSGKNDESKGVRTSRVTKNSVGAIKAESTNVVKMYGGDLTLLHQNQI